MHHYRRAYLPVRPAFLLPAQLTHDDLLRTPEGFAETDVSHQNTINRHYFSETRSCFPSVLGKLVTYAHKCCSALQ